MLALAPAAAAPQRSIAAAMAAALSSAAAGMHSEIDSEIEQRRDPRSEIEQHRAYLRGAVPASAVSDRPLSRGRSSARRADKPLAGPRYLTDALRGKLPTTPTEVTSVVASEIAGPASEMAASPPEMRTSPDLRTDATGDYPFRLSALTLTHTLTLTLP